MTDRKTGLAAIFIITVVLYMPIFEAAAVWDDTTLLQAAVLQGWWGPLPFSVNYFRPLGTVSLLLESRLSMPIAAHHIINVLIHSTNVLLLTILLGRLLPKSSPAWIGPVFGLVYAIHPALIEGVAFISSRFDLLMTFGLLMAMYLDDRLDGIWRPLGVGLAYVFAALSKESAASFLPVLAAWHLARGHGLRQRWTSYAAVLAGGVLYLFLRSSALPELYSTTMRDRLDVGTFWQHLLLVGHSLEQYLLVSLWPFGTTTPIHFAALPLTDGQGVRGLVVAVLLLTGVGVACWRGVRAGFVFAAGILSLLPALNIIPLELTGGSFIAERYLLFPMCFFVLGVGMVCGPQLPRLMATSQGGIVPCVLALLLVTHQTGLTHWQNSEALWSWGLEVAPRSPMPATNLSEHLNQIGRPQEGLSVALEGIRRDPDEVLPWNNVGQALFLLGDYPGAEQHFREALTRDPETVFIWTNLAAAILEQGRLEEAEHILLNESLRRELGNPEAMLNLAGLYLKAGRPDLAIQQLDGLLMRGPSPRADAMRAEAMQPARWVTLSGFLLQEGDIAGAERALQEAVRQNANPIEVGLSRSALLVQARKFEDAFQLLKALQQQAPQDARISYNAGIVVLELAGPQVARGWFEQAAQLAPDWPLPQQQLAQLPSPPPVTP